MTAILGVIFVVVLVVSGQFVIDKTAGNALVPPGGGD